MNCYVILGRGLYVDIIITQRFGLTTLTPDKAPLYKWLTNAIYDPHYWEWFSGHVWNGGNQKAVEYDIQNDVGNNHSLGMAVYPNGELHVFANGKDVGTPWQNLPLDLPLYGVVGLENFGIYGSFKLGKGN